MSRRRSKTMSSQGQPASAAVEAAQSTDIAAGKEVFTISAKNLRQRTHNILYGAGLSVLLVLLVGWGHLERPETYNDVLLWSIVGFVVLVNTIGYVRHRRYLALARKHRLLIDGHRIRFETGDQVSILHRSDIAAVRVYRKRKGIGHIQIRRTDGRGIRLEGYDDMERMAATLKPMVPAAHWQDRGR